MVDVTVPELANGEDEAAIVAWLVSDGDTVHVGDPLVELETDKATFELESHWEGTLRIVVSHGRVTVGSVVATVATGDEAAARAATPDGAAAEGARPVAAAPAARRLAAELDVDLAQVVGTGPGGRIQREDVLAATGGTGGQAPLDDPAAPRTDAAQLAIARRTALAKSTVPHFYMRATVRMDAAVEFKRSFNESAAGTPLTLNHLIVRACGLALVAVPRLNATWAEDHVANCEAVNIGIVVSTGDSLYVPVIKNVDDLSLAAIAREAGRLVTSARTRRLTQDQAEGASFSISNAGMMGIDEFAAIIYPPQAAILAVGRVADAPVVVDGALTVGKAMNLTLSVDHRVAYGGDAAEFLNHVRSLLENPNRLERNP